MKKQVICFFCFISLFFINPATASNELAGMVVVIDPGHGGKDPGASGYFLKGGKKFRVTESAYCYDVALRLERILTKKGAKVVRTTKNNSWKAPVADAPNQVIRDNNSALFTWDGSSVRAGSNAIARRVKIANRSLTPGSKVVFISIHFDVLGDEDLEGARIIAGESANNLSALLENELEKERRISNSDRPVLKNGDRSHGIKKIHVLGRTNKIKQKALIELGNFKNQKDLWRIRDYKVRENYAQIVTRALIKLNGQ